MILQGRIPGWSYADGMRKFLAVRGIGIFDFKRISGKSSGFRAPFRLRFYCNLHNWLASQLSAAGIENRMMDNAFVEIGDWEKAQAMVDGFAS